MFTVFTNRNSFHTLLISFVGTFNIVFFSGFFPNVLTEQKISKNEYFPDDSVGYVYASQCFSYIITCIIFKYFCYNIPRKFGFLLSILLSSVLMFLLGPSTFLNIDDEQKYKYIVSAFILSGIS